MQTGSYLKWFNLTNQYLVLGPINSQGGHRGNRRDGSYWSYGFARRDGSYWSGRWNGSARLSRPDRKCGTNGTHRFYWSTGFNRSRRTYWSNRSGRR